jgi:hypothetical protein
MGGAAQVAMRVASQIWQVVFASQTFQVFCLALCKKAQYVVVKVGFCNSSFTCITLTLGIGGSTLFLNRIALGMRRFNNLCSSFFTLLGMEDIL